MGWSSEFTIRVGLLPTQSWSSFDTIKVTIVIAIAAATTTDCSHQVVLKYLCPNYVKERIGYQIKVSGEAANKQPDRGKV